MSYISFEYFKNDAKQKHIIYNIVAILIVSLTPYYLITIGLFIFYLFVFGFCATSLFK